MNRKKITKFLSDLLIYDKLTGQGKYYASEVTLDYGHGKGKEKRVDFMQFVPVNQISVSGLEKGKFICYEVKSCKEDFNSGCGLNFVGEQNYIVTTMQTYKDILPEVQKLGIHIGIMVAIPRVRSALNDFDNPTSIPEDNSYSNWKLEIVKPSYNGNRKRSMIELLFCMMRSGK